MRHLNPQKKPIIRIRQIPTIRLPMQRNVMLIRQRQQFLQIPGLAHQPIRVIHNHMPHPTRPNHGQQRIPPRTPPSPLPRRTVVIHKHTPRRNDQPQPVGNRTAQPLLAIHSRLVLIPSTRHPAVDRRRLTKPPRHPTSPPTPASYTLSVTLNIIHATECTKDQWAR
jgi:hypothetical protein